MREKRFKGESLMKGEMMAQVYEDEEITDDFKKAFGDKRTLNVGEVARYMGCSCKHVVRLCDSCQVASFRISDGRNAPLRIIRTSLLWYLQQRNGFNRKLD